MMLQHTLLKKWRLCATGMAFITFMAGSAVVAIIAIPMIQLLGDSIDSKRQKILRLIHYLFRIFIRYALFLGVIKTFEVEGLENIQDNKNYIFVANHPSLIDVVAIMSCIPNCNCIVKQSLLNHVLFGSIVRAAGYIVNNRAIRLMRDCEENLKAGRSLIVFPEGTRSPAYGLRTFKRGAAQIALRTGVPIVLVIITCDPPILSKGQPWYKVPEHSLRFKLQFHLLSTCPEEIHQRCQFSLKVKFLNQYLEDLVRERLQVSTPVG
jgi:1-acyl-sn-glycerol-3-phosphate acyltransferase